jgi:hypothetical protein
LSAASERAGRLLAKMTSEEKVALAVHDFEALAHLGIPPCGTPTAPAASAGRAT